MRFRFPPASRTVVGYIVTGQSLSTGVRAGLVLMDAVTPGPIPGHFMLGNLVAGGVEQDPADWTLDEVANPMREQEYNSFWPFNAWDESPCAAFSERMGELGVPHTFTTCAGQDGQAYAAIKKGGSVPSYAGSIAEAEKAYELLTAAGYSLTFGGVILIHGESDTNSATYDDDLIEFQGDYEADLQAITGQVTPIPMYITQPSAGYPTANGSRTTTHQLILDLCAANPTTHKLCGPKYSFEHASGDLHLTPTGTRDMARLYADQVFDFVGGLYMTGATRSGAVITATLALPTGSTGLALDSSLWDSNHAAQNTEWDDGKGFEAAVPGPETPLTISSVAVASANTVTITLSADPGAAVLLRYAETIDGDGKPRRGQLRTNDGHWCCHGTLTTT